MNIYEDKVEVNQRHLIDKILARYSAEFTVFRELLQNSNDALATKAEIAFYDSDSQDISVAHDIMTQMGGSEVSLPNRDAVSEDANESEKQYSVIRFRNNGRSFRAEDWSRLKNIAEGNPDEQKIGFFGVGFYSLFSLTENPLVLSGNEAMLFIWRGNQLFTKRAVQESAFERISEVSDNKESWTSFYMLLRDRQDAPRTAELGQFLVKSLAFTTSLVNVKYFTNGECQFELEKRISPPSVLEIPKRTYSLGSAENTFSIEKVETNSVQMTVTAILPPERLVLKQVVEDGLNTAVKMIKRGFGSWFGFGPSETEQPTLVETAEPKNEQKTRNINCTVFMRVATAVSRASCSKKWIVDMERSTKKRPPSYVQHHLLWTNYAELQCSEPREKTGGLFDGLSTATEQGKIFIGFPTFQTTGGRFHLASHFIPTVERESIDFVDPMLAQWNERVLAIGGILGRLCYDEEVRAQKTISEASENHIAHALSCFTFKPSTPNVLVSNLMQLYFYRCSSQLPLVYTTAGPRKLDEAYLRDAKVLQFAPTLPMLTEHFTETCSDAIKQWKEARLIKSASLSSILAYFDSKALLLDEFIAFISWYAALPREKTGGVRIDDVRRHITLQLDPGDAASTIALRNINTYNRSKDIPGELPLPFSTLPPAVSDKLSSYELESVLCLSPVYSVDYCSFLVSEPQVFKQPPSAQLALHTLGNFYKKTQNETEKALICSQLSDIRCVPVRPDGMMYPRDVYLQDIPLFKELSAIDQGRFQIDKAFLLALGLREHVEMEVIFKRLFSAEWNSTQLVKYLVTIRASLVDHDWEKLRAAPIFAAEKPPHTKCKASELYFKTKELEIFDLPWVPWEESSRLSEYSAEGQFLEDLGVRKQLDLEFFYRQFSRTELAASHRSLYLDYFLSHLTVLKFKPRGKFQKLKFLPLSHSSAAFGAPENTFSDAAVALFGFNVIAPQYRAFALQLGLAKHPPIAALVDALLARPPNEQNRAQELFGYLSTISSEFAQQNWSKLQVGEPKFVPVFGEKLVMSHPKHLFLEKAASQPSEFDDCFLYVDFGISGNAFLKACGARNEPRAQDLIEQVVQSPQQFLDRMGVEKYKQFLQTTARSYYAEISSGNPHLHDKLALRPWLLGLKEDACILASASEIVLVDDTLLVKIFHPVTCPMDSNLESLYAQLGSKWLSEVVRERFEPQAPIIAHSAIAATLQERIRERAPLIFSDYFGQEQPEKLQTMQAYLEHIRVIAVPGIDVHRTFTLSNAKSTSKVDACMANDSSGQLALYVKDSNNLLTDEIDYFDIGQVLGRYIFGKSRFQKGLLISSILDTNLDKLRARGLPVDRLIQPKQKPQLPVAVHRSDSKRKDFANVPESVLKNAQDESLLSQIATFMPNADMEKVKELVVKHGGDSDKVINELVDSLNHTKENSSSSESTTNRDSFSANGKSKDEAFTNETSIKQDSFANKRNSKKDVLHSEFNERRESLSYKSNTKELVDSDWSKRTESLDNQFERPGNSHGIKKFIEKFSLFSGNPPKHSAETTDTRQNVAKTENDLRSVLEQGIRSCKSGSGDSDLVVEHDLNQRERQVDELRRQLQMAETSMVKNERTHFCHSVSPDKLQLVSKRLGVSVYVDVAFVQRPEAMESLLTADLSLFSFLLQTLATRVFSGLKLGTLNIFYDEKDKIIAFNRNATLFFNFRFFQLLHGTKSVSSSSLQLLQAGSASNFSKEHVASLLRLIPEAAFHYWFMVFCHELAHNYVQEHNMDHGFYCESYSKLYMGHLFNLLKGE